MWGEVQPIVGDPIPRQVGLGYIRKVTEKVKVACFKSVPPWSLLQFLTPGLLSFYRMDYDL